MKKFISPLIVFAGAFLSTLLLQKNSFVIQEYDGLFLVSSDYFTSMLQGPFPISGIISDFLTQFFRFSIYAPAIVAAGVLLTFLMVRGIQSKFSLSGDWLPAAASCALWLIAAFSPTAKRGVSEVLILFIVWAATRLLPERTARKPLPAWVDTSFSSALTTGVFLFIAFNGSLRDREQTASLRVAAVMSDWDRVLAVATPQKAASDPDVMPYAFLALGEKGRLGNELFRYPVRSRGDFDYSERPEDYARYFFNTALYETLKCPNEAIHNYFQLATYQEHGQSFLVLRRLLDDYFMTGNYDLALKYAVVLSKSTLHSQYVHYFTERMAGGTSREPDSIAYRKSVPLIAHDPLSNLILLGAGGINTRASVDRVLCSLLLNRDIENFQAVFSSVPEMYPTIPRYYEEALVMAGKTEGISPSTLQRYSQFQADYIAQSPAWLQQRYSDTFWLYYLSSPADSSASIEDLYDPMVSWPVL